MDGKAESEFEGLVANAAEKPNVVNQATDPWILEKGLCRIDGIGEDFIAVGKYATDSRMIVGRFSADFVLNGEPLS